MGKKKKKNKKNTSQKKVQQSVEKKQEEVVSEDVKVEKKEAKAEQKAEKKEAKKEKKAAKKEAKEEKKEEKAASNGDFNVLSSARANVDAGNYRVARAELAGLLESSSDAEVKSQAREILGSLEMDTRTLMVGVLGMITLLLIPAFGFKHALWTLPIPLLLLLLDPSLFRAPESND